MLCSWPISTYAEISAIVIVSPIKNLDSLNQPVSIASKAFSILDFDVSKKSSEKFKSFLTFGATRPIEASLTFL